MATCPNCGEIVMNGDPYCTNCGATLRWTFDDEEDYEHSSDEEDSDNLHELYRLMVKSDMTTDERFDLFKDYLFLTDYQLDEVRQEIHSEEEMYGCRFIMVYTAPYLKVFIFLRQDKYRDVMIFNRCYVEHFPGRFDPEGREFHYVYTRLLENEKFKRQVVELAKEGLEFNRVYSDISIPFFDGLRVEFTDGNNDVTYGIDEDLNFKRLL